MGTVFTKIRECLPFVAAGANRLFLRLAFSTFAILFLTGCGHEVVWTIQDVTVVVRDHCTKLVEANVAVECRSHGLVEPQGKRWHSLDFGNERTRVLSQTDQQGRALLRLDTRSFYNFPGLLQRISHPPLRDQVSGRKVVLTLTRGELTENLVGIVRKGSIVKGITMEVEFEYIAAARYRWDVEQ